MKDYIKRKDARAAYTFGKEILEKNPKHEFASYGAAWGAFRLGKFKDSLQLISAALEAAPEKYQYISLRGTARLKLGQYYEAYLDFKKMETLRQRPIYDIKSFQILELQWPVLTSSDFLLYGDYHMF